MKTVTEMAREAQMPFYWCTEGIPYLDKLERFAELVRADERERIKEANAPEIEKINANIKALEDEVVAEREACAKVCEELQSPPDWNVVAVLWKECRSKLAEAIRARGTHET